MLSVPIISCTNSNSSFYLPVQENSRCVATAVKSPIQDLTKTINVYWLICALGDNYFRLISFSNLQKGWDGYAADKIPTIVIDRVFSLLLNTSFHPKIFPTSRGSVQVEYYQNDNKFVEIEIFKNRISVYSEGLWGTIDKDNITEKEACKLLEVAYGK